MSEDEQAASANSVRGRNTGYSSRVVDHMVNPRNLGEIPGATGVGQEENPICGDVMTVWVRVQNDVVVAAGFEVRGCAPSIAAGSMMTEMVKGLPVSDAQAITRHDLSRALDGLPPVKGHCALLAVSTLRKALAESRTSSG